MAVSFRGAHFPKEIILPGEGAAGRRILSARVMGKSSGSNVVCLSITPRSTAGSSRTAR
jgi:hypothetical protein